MKKKYVFDLTIVGRRIREARERTGSTQEEIAKETNITGQYWSMMERGRYGGSVNTYLQIATALGLTLNDLFYSETEIIRTKKQFSEDSFLADCDDYEQAVLLEILFSMKSILIEMRGLNVR